MCLAPFGIHIWIYNGWVNVHRCKCIHNGELMKGCAFLCGWDRSIYHVQIHDSYLLTTVSTHRWQLDEYVMLLITFGGYMLYDDDGDGLMDMPCCLFQSVGICCMSPRWYTCMRQNADPCLQTVLDILNRCRPCPPALPCYTESVGIQSILAATVFIFHSVWHEPRSSQH